MIKFTNISSPVLEDHSQISNHVTLIIEIIKNNLKVLPLKAEEKRATEDEMVGWYHRFSGLELGQTLGDGEGWGSLVCCSPWGHEESDMTWQLTTYLSSHLEIVKSRQLRT